MKNADMPATPTKITVPTHSPRGSGYPSSREVECAGLTKREYAVIKIMSGFASAPDIEVNLEQISKFSVAWADALLKELEK